MKSAYLLFIFGLILCHIKAEVELCDDDYKQFIEGNKFTFVKLYTPTCGWCKSLKPTWSAVAKSLEGIIPIVSLDVSVNKKAQDHLSVRSVPKLLFFSGDFKNFEAYSGARTEKALISYVLSKLPIQTLNFEDGMRYLASGITQNFPPRVALVCKDENSCNVEFDPKMSQIASLAKFVVPEDRIQVFKEQFPHINTYPSIVSTINGQTAFIQATELSNDLAKANLFQKIEGVWVGKEEPLLNAEDFSFYFFGTIVLVSLFIILGFVFMRSEAKNIKVF